MTDTPSIGESVSQVPLNVEELQEKTE